MGKIPIPAARGDIEKMRGVIDYACWKGVYYARKWPQPRKPTVTAGNIQHIADFAAAANAISNVGPSERLAAQDIAVGTGWTWRDVLTNAAWGKLIEFTPPTP